MVEIISNSIERLRINDLNDVFYYHQVKSFNIHYPTQICSDVTEEFNKIVFVVSVGEELPASPLRQSSW